MPRVMILDLETENHPYYGAVASPKCPENYVVAIGQVIEEVPFSAERTGMYFNSKEEAANWLSIPDDVWCLVAHNAMFELKWMLGDQREEITKFLKRGGRVFCTAYAEYLLSNQQTTYPDLNSTAPKYGGTQKVDGIKILWSQGKLTSEIDKGLLFDDYLMGPGGDIENTRKVFYAQWALLESRGMLAMALERMEGMLFNAYAEDSGLFVDRDVAFSQMETATVRLKELQAKFAEFRGHIPPEVEFKDSSDYHMSAWLFGGGIKYRAQDVWLNEDGTPKYEKDDFYKFTDGTMLPVSYFEDDTANPCTDPDALTERKNLAVLNHGPIEKFKSGKNKGQPKVFREDTTEVKLKWYDKILLVQGLIGIEKMPKDVLKSFKEEFTGKRVLCDGTPVYSTGADCIEMLSKRAEFADRHDILSAIEEFAKLNKDLGTYYLREKLDEEGNVVKVSGMLQYLTPENIVYHNLNCTSTVTGRLSSTKPNLQNIPRGDTSDVKNMFRSRFGDDGVIIEADYSALEVVTLAAFSKDKNLVKALLDGIDMHCMRLSQQLGESYESVLIKCKDEAHPEHKQYKSMRTAVKPKAFAFQYGATAHGIAFATGCSVEEAQAFIDAEKALFPDVEAYYDDVITKAVEQNVKWHREEYEIGKYRIFGVGTWQAPGGTCYEFRQYPKTLWVDGRKVESMQFKPTQIRNYPIQGESGFFVQGIAGLVVRWLISRDFFNGKVFIINQVHDALYLDCHKDVLQEVASTLKIIMESLPEHFKKYGYDLGVPFPCEVEAGPSMNEKVKVA